MQGKLTRAAQLLLGFVALLGAVEPAVAAGNTIKLGSADVWTVYAFGNAQAVSDAFRALTNFAASGTFQSIVSLVAVLGVLGVGASGGFNPSQARKLIGYFVGVFLVTYVLFGVGNGGPLVVNLEVIDSVDMTWKAPVTVPAVVGIPASIISTAGYRITEAVEASFALPDALKMTHGAPFNLAASMISDASQARITDPNLSASLGYYVQDCFTIGVARGTLSATTLLHSTNFLNDIQFPSKTVMVNTQLLEAAGTAGAGTPGVVSCAEAWSLINSAINAQGTGAADFLKDASAWTKTPAMSVVNAAADRTAQWASNGGITDGGALVKQSAVLSAFRGAYSQAATQTGNSEFITSLALAQATESQRSSWITGAEVFNKTMGYIFAILQVFVYAITPLVLCACLVPGLGLALLKNFAQILLWLAIWQPMLAIVNFIIISMQQAELGGVLSTGSAYGFTLSNMGIVSEKTANLRAAATFVGTMVPALAWAMVKGSVDFSRVIGSAVGENFAQGAANTMTTGNYSLNQASMDSFTANKHSVASTGAWGSGRTTSDGVAATEINTGGSAMPSAHREQLALNTSSSLNRTEGSNGGSNAARQAGGTIGDAAGDTISRTVTGTGATAGGNSLTSGDAGGIHFTGGGTAGFAVKKAGDGRNADGTVVPGGNAAGGGGGGGNDPADSTPANRQGRIAKLMDRTKADLNGGANGTYSLTQNEQDNYSKTHNLAVAGTAQKSGAQTVNSTRGANHSDTAGQVHGAQSGDSQTVTGINSAFSRAQMTAAYMHTDGFMDDDGWGSLAPASNPLGNKVQQLGQADYVRNAVDAENAQNRDAERKYGKEADNIANLARKKSAENRGAGEKVIAEEAVAVDKSKDAAGKKPSERIGDAAGQKIRDTIAGAKEFGEKGKEWLEEKGEKVKDVATAAGEKGLEAGKHVREWMTNKNDNANEAKPAAASPQQPSTQPQGTQPGAQPAGSQPGAQQPSSKNAQPPKHEPHHDREAPPAQKQHLRAEQAGPGQHKDDKPHRDSVAARDNGNDPSGKPGAEQQRDRDMRELQDRQDRQLAATAAVGQALQATQLVPAQPQPQQPAMPALGVGEQPGQQLASAQQPQQLNTAAPNPFSGDKSGESSAQLQGEVQMAEQRAERMGNQLKGVDGMLASADGRKPSDLPDIISQARDLVRNA